MRSGTPRLIAGLLLLALVSGVLGPSATPSAQARRSLAPPLVRVGQAGYLLGRPVTAWLMSPRDATGQRYEVRDRGGDVVLRGRALPATGRWNKRYRAIHPLDLSALPEAGDYRVVLLTRPRVRSPWFHLGTAGELVDPLLADTIAFFQAQRDGTAVLVGDLRSGPSHGNDATARLYAWPLFADAEGEVIEGDLEPLGGDTDASGGWSDAGDYIKLTHTTAFADALLWAAARELAAAAPDTLVPEAAHGLAWLERMWHPDSGVLDLQVGLGTGAADGTIVGDHDVWRLPETDDQRVAAPERYLAHRPVFRANDAGTPVPPNLAGRVSAAFALASQVHAATDAGEARRLLDLAASLFTAAKVRDVTPEDVVTAIPAAWYPESSWRDDMAWAAAELALAGQALGDSRPGRWLDAGATFALGYLEYEAGGGTLDVYDTGALALAELVRALRASPDAADDVSVPMLLDGVRAQLEPARELAALDPFRAGVDYAGFDAAPHAFGLVATAGLYRQLTGDEMFVTFETAQLDWALGANAWGTSFLIGAGRSYPRCPHHMVANLAVGADGSTPILRGAVVSGPNAASLFDAGLDTPFPEMRPCPADGDDRFADLVGHGSRFVDDVRAWQTVEPAIDMTAIATLALALTR
jgi:hypothetical protein